MWSKIAEVCVTICTLFSCFCLCLSCDENKMKTQLEQLRSKTVQIPYDEMLWLSDTGYSYGVKQKQTEYTMVIYVDSSECTPCAFKTLYAWNSILDVEKEKSLKFIFIVDAKNSNLLDIQNMYNSSMLVHEIFVDTSGIFAYKNSHIPENKLFHSFLLNDRQEVVFVGAPIHGEKMKRLFYKRIEHSY